MRKVLIPTKLNSIAAGLLSKHKFEVVQDADSTLPELLKDHSDATALIVRSEKVDSAIIDLLPNLKVIVRAGAGYNTIDIKHARRKGIEVMNTPGANANAVAEEVVAMILAGYRHIIQGDITTRQGLWEKKRFMGRELTGKTVGVIGLGNIGQLVIKRLSGFECTILGYDPVISASKAEALGIELCSLEEMFRGADIITLHIPYSNETKGVINKSYLSLLKPRSMLINCARSGIIDEEDLRSLKKEKEIFFCNDVYDQDAPGDKSIQDVADIMLPHVGANTEEANLTAARRAAEQLIAYTEQGINTYVVNKAVPDGLNETHLLLAFYLGKVARCYLGCESQPDRIEISVYGELHDYANWLIAPIVSGISSDFDPMFDFQDASEYLKEKGISYKNREIDESKGYDQSLTVDLLEGKGTTLNRVSVRGTLAEGNPMISRISHFDKLYFEPRGYSIIATYDDQPGMLAKISSVVARHTINIIDIRCPFDPKSGESIAILKVNQEVDQNIISEIQHESGANKVVFLSL